MTKEEVLAGLLGFGHRAFGYQNGNLMLEPQEAAAIRQAYVDLLERGISTADICRASNDAGLLTPFGKLWRRETVNRVLLRPRDAGVVVHRGVVLEDVAAQWEPLVSRETLDAATARLTRTLAPGARQVHLASGIAQGATCGGRLLTYYGNRE